jgi:hypothetical protein
MQQVYHYTITRLIRSDMRCVSGVCTLLSTAGEYDHDITLHSTCACIQQGFAIHNENLQFCTQCANNVRHAAHEFLYISMHACMCVMKWITFCCAAGGSDEYSGYTTT